MGGDILASPAVKGVLTTCQPITILCVSSSSRIISDSGGVHLIYNTVLLLVVMCQELFTVHFSTEDTKIRQYSKMNPSVAKSDYK